MPGISKGYDTEATRALRERLGAPAVTTHQGQQLSVWRLSEEGRGAVCARLSARDIAKGETALGQVQATLELCASCGIEPGYVVVAIRTSGALDYDHRLDFLYLREIVAAGEIDWVAFRLPERIARNTLAAQLFYRFLQQTRTDLYLVTLGRAVDWTDERDRLVVNTLGLISDFERGAIYQRTHGALVRRFLEAGRGWPGAIRFGFRRDAHGYLEVDPEQWPYVKRAHHDYATLDPSGQTSIRALAAHLVSLGCPISRDRLRKVLQDPIYVTGDWSVTHDGTEYPGRPIKLDDPILRAIFDRNQALMHTMKARHRVNPLGWFLLNRTTLLHEACMHDLDEHGRPPRLRGYPNDKYRHTRCPRPQCRGLSIPREALDHEVIQQLRALCEDPGVQRAWAENARTAGELPLLPGLLSEQHVSSLRTKIDNLTRERARLMRDWIDGVAAGKTSDRHHLEELIEVIDAEVEGHCRQLAIDEKAAQAPASREQRDEIGDLRARARDVLTLDPPEDPELRQRRVAFVQAVVAAVVVRDTDDGFEVEIRGPRGPREVARESIDPVVYGADVLRGQPASKGCLASQFGAGVPLWRSGWLPLHPQPRRTNLSMAPGRGIAVEYSFEVLRTVSATAPRGLLRGQTLRTFLRDSGLEITVRQIEHSLASDGLTLDEAYRRALGVEHALWLRRVPLASAEDLEIVVGWALDVGWRPGPYWWKAWDEVARQHRQLPAHTGVLGLERRLDIDLRDVVSGALESRGLPEACASQLRRRPGRRRRNQAAFETCLAAMRWASDRAAPGAMTYQDVAALVADQRHFPTGHLIQDVMQTRRVRRGDAWRLALGVEKALRLGRVRPQSLGEYVTVASWALVDGLVLGRGWVDRWDAMRERVPYLPVATAIWHVLGPDGAGEMFELAHQHAELPGPPLEIPVGPRRREEPRNVAEVLMTLAQAVEEGLDLAPGWSARYETFQRTHPYLCSRSKLHRLALGEGTSVDAIVCKPRRAQTSGERR